MKYIERTNKIIMINIQNMYMKHLTYKTKKKQVLKIPINFADVKHLIGVLV